MGKDWVIREDFLHEGKALLTFKVPRDKTQNQRFQSQLDQMDLFEVTLFDCEKTNLTSLVRKMKETIAFLQCLKSTSAEGLQKMTKTTPQKPVIKFVVLDQKKQKRNHATPNELLKNLKVNP